jgi:hypothetical protein
MTKKSLEKIQEVFIYNFGHLHLKIPDENLVNRRKSSIPYGSGKLFYIFGEEGGREGSVEKSSDSTIFFKTQSKNYRKIRMIIIRTCFFIKSVHYGVNYHW